MGTLYDSWYSGTHIELDIIFSAKALTTLSLGGTHSGVGYAILILFRSPAFQPYPPMNGEKFVEAFANCCMQWPIHTSLIRFKQLIYAYCSQACWLNWYY